MVHAQAHGHRLHGFASTIEHESLKVEGTGGALVLADQRSEDLGDVVAELTRCVPGKAIGTYDMDHSPDFRRIGGGAVLVEREASWSGDENWGFPHLFQS